MIMRECPKCKGSGQVPAHYDVLFDDLFEQTPKEVWQQYLTDGYNLRDAIKEERSQA